MGKVYAVRFTRYDVPDPLETIHGAVLQAQAEKVAGELSGPEDGNGLRTLYERGEERGENTLVVSSASVEGITNFVRRICDRYGQLVEVEELAEPPGGTSG